MVNFCDVFNLENEKIISEKTFSEISEILNVPRNRVVNSFYRKSRICGVYLVVKSESEEEKEYKSANADLILAEWENVVKPFKNIEWVKSYSYGTRVLGAKKT